LRTERLRENPLPVRDGAAYSSRVSKVFELIRLPSGVVASTCQRSSAPAGRPASASAGIR